MGKPGEPTELHPQCEDVPFDMRRSNALRIWAAPSWHWNGADHAGWRIALVWGSGSGIDLASYAKSTREKIRTVYGDSTKERVWL
jgi:hypothetical protein